MAKRTNSAEGERETTPREDSQSAFPVDEPTASANTDAEGDFTRAEAEARRADEQFHRAIKARDDAAKALERAERELKEADHRRLMAAPGRIPAEKRGKHLSLADARRYTPAISVQPTIADLQRSMRRTHVGPAPS